MACLAVLVQRLAEFINNLIDMAALSHKSRGENSVITGEFHVQAVPEHVFLQLGPAATRDTVMLDFDPGHHANTTQVGNQRMIL